MNGLSEESELSEDCRVLTRAGAKLVFSSFRNQVFLPASVALLCGTEPALSEAEGCSLWFALCIEPRKWCQRIVN